MEKHWALFFMVGLTLGAHIDVIVGKSLENETKAVKGVTHGFNQTNGQYDFPNWNRVESDGRDRAVMEEDAFYKRGSLSELTRKKRSLGFGRGLCRRGIVFRHGRCQNGSGRVRQGVCIRGQLFIDGRCQKVSGRFRSSERSRSSVRSGRTNCNCGLAKREEMILGGIETEVNEYPWQVGIVWRSTLTVMCGGSLISNMWMMSAAHCTKNSITAPMIQALLGEHDITSSVESVMIRKDISNIVNHPYYVRRTKNYDFSLLKLKTSIDFSSVQNIRPICLPQNDDKDYATYDAIITGWGQTVDIGERRGAESDNLMETTLRVLSNHECNNNYEHESSRITDQMMCTHVQEGGRGFCRGDSGGPIITSGAGNGQVAGQNYELIGVVSWNAGECGDANYPGVTARVSKQLKWIRIITRSWWSYCPRV